MMKVAVEILYKLYYEIIKKISNKMFIFYSWKKLSNFRYGVSHLYGTFQMAKWEVNVTDDTTNTTVTVPYNSTVTVDSNEIQNIMFHTPLGKSFTCKDIGDFSLVTKIKYKPTAYNIDLVNATIETGHLHFDAFRPNTSDPLVWRVSTYLSILFYSKL